MDFGVYDLWWPFVWILGTFLVPELLAAFDKKPGGTLSEWVWKVFALRPGTAQRWRHARRWAFGCFWASLSLHFLFGTSAWALVVYALPVAWSVWYHYRRER
jgi:hypothetical protein